MIVVMLLSVILLLLIPVWLFWAMVRINYVPPAPPEPPATEQELQQAVQDAHWALVLGHYRGRNP